MIRKKPESLFIAASGVFATFLSTSVHALNSISTADCPVEQKQFLQLHVGGYYKENVENVAASVRYISNLQEAGANNYLAAMEKQKARNEKIMADHIQRWGDSDIPRGVQMDIASDTLTICFTRARLGLPALPPPADAPVRQSQPVSTPAPATITPAAPAPALSAARAGQIFLAENGKKPGVKKTGSGLQYEVLKEGSGEHPGPYSRVTVHYKGTLVSGETFDSSYTSGRPVTFRLDQVISGWTEGLQLMTAGSRYKFFIPAHLAYGSQPVGNLIPPNSALVFDVELLTVE